jgi:hypothetical protein
MNWCLSCSSLWACDLGLILWWFWTGWTALAVLPVLAVLDCSWFLVTYQCNPVDGMARVYCGGFIWSPSPSLVDNKAWQPVGDSPAVCVWCAACTLLCEQPSCVCVHILGIWLVSWLRVDQLGRLDIIHHSHFFLTCQVAMPLGITFLLLWLCAGINLLLQWSWRSSSTRLNEV